MDKQQESFDSGEQQSLFVRGLLSVLRVLLILGLLFYVLYHLTNGFSAELRTEVVRLYDEQVLLNTSGIIVRDEALISENMSGVVSYRFENGSKVNKNAKVAVIYGGSSDAAAVARVAELDKTIDFLEETNAYGDISVSDGIAASKEISEMLLVAAEQISRGKYGEAVDKDALVRTFIKRDTTLNGGTDGVSASLEELKAERASLERLLSGSGTSVKTASAGYFYDYADGGEGVFDYAEITAVTPSEYRSGLARITDEASAKTAIGKIVSVPKWYFLCLATKEQCIALGEGKTYELLFSASDMRIDMKLEAENIEGNEAVLVFSAKEMPSGFDFSRNQKVSIVTETVSGYRVPSSALRVVDGTVGVYIRVGNTVKFRVADVIYESGSYSFVSTKTEGKTLFAADTDTENDIYCKGLSLYDNVIVSGSKELSPDRIVN